MTTNKPRKLTGSCQCGSIQFTLDSQTPVPYQHCACSICRKVGGYSGAVNLGGIADSLRVVSGKELIKYVFLLHIHMSRFMITELLEMCWYLVLIKEIQRHQRPRKTHPGEMLVWAELLLQLQYHALAMGSSLARVDSSLCICYWYRVARSRRDDVYYGQLETGLGAVAWGEEECAWFLRGR